MCLMAVTVLSVNAQQRGNRENMTPEKMAERMTEKMTEDLKLDEAQKQEVYDLNLESANKRTEMMAKEQTDKKAARENMKADQEAHEAKLKEILTNDQFVKWEEIQKEQREKMKDRRGGGGRPQ